MLEVEPNLNATLVNSYCSICGKIVLFPRQDFTSKVISNGLHHFIQVLTHLLVMVLGALGIFSEFLKVRYLERCLSPWQVKSHHQYTSAIDESCDLLCPTKKMNEYHSDD